LKKVTANELRRLAADARESIWAQAEEEDREPKIYLHWTAGHYYQTFDSYHVNIVDDGTMYLMDDLDEVLAHTWLRNTGAVGITLCCGVGADTEDLGPEPPTAAQLKAMAEAICAIADGLWLTINKTYVLTHGEAADNEDGLDAHEDYGPNTTCERWDLEYLETEDSPEFNPEAEDGSRGGDVIRAMANEVRRKNNGAALA
jgi:hypothetical protein